MLMPSFILFFIRDRKKKKFVTTNDNAAGKKKIRTESGAMISASYKSRAYPFKKNLNGFCHLNLIVLKYMYKGVGLSILDVWPICKLINIKF